MIPAQQHGEPSMAEPRARGEALWFAALLAVPGPTVMLVVRANDKHPQVNAAWGLPSRDRNPAAVNRR